MYQFYTLSNGLRIGAEEIPYVKSVTAGFFIRAGGMTERKCENGISHFVEHMLFKGTKRRNACQIVREIDQTGGTLNAFTTDEYTCFYVKTLDRQLPIAIDVLCDMLFHSNLTSENMELEKKVIREEISLYEDSPEEVVGDLLSECTWGDCPAGRPILGKEDQILAFRREDLLSYMKRFYHPENMIFSIAGSFDLQEVIRLLEEKIGTFGNWKADFPDSPLVFHSDVVYREKDAGQTQIALGFRGISSNDEDLYPMLAVNTLFGGGMSSRLFQHIREERGLAYSIGSYPICYNEAGMFAISAGISPENTEETVELILDDMKYFCKNGISEEELAAAKNQLAGGYLLGLESTSSRMSHLGKELLLERPVRTQDDVLHRIDCITRKDTNRVIQRFFDTERFSLAAAGAVSPWIKKLKPSTR